MIITVKVFDLYLYVYTYDRSGVKNVTRVICHFKEYYRMNLMRVNIYSIICNGQVSANKTISIDYTGPSESVYTAL